MSLVFQLDGKTIISELKTLEAKDIQASHYHPDLKQLLPPYPFLLHLFLLYLFQYLLFQRFNKISLRHLNDIRRITRSKHLIKLLYDLLLLSSSIFKPPLTCTAPTIRCTMSHPPFIISGCTIPAAVTTTRAATASAEAVLD